MLFRMGVLKKAAPSLPPSLAADTPKSLAGHLPGTCITVRGGLKDSSYSFRVVEERSGEGQDVRTGHKGLAGSSGCRLYVCARACVCNVCATERSIHPSKDLSVIFIPVNK